MTKQQKVRFIVLTACDQTRMLRAT